MTLIRSHDVLYRMPENGTSGPFKSTVFYRTNGAAPSTPTGGSYSCPVPDSRPIWSDGIPEGEEKLYASTRIFTVDGESPQQNAWSTPRLLTDTAGLEIRYSSYASPGTPASHPVYWSSSSSTSSIWMAVRVSSNGVWGDWSVTKIKGEKGDPGASASDGITPEIYTVETNFDTIRQDVDFKLMQDYSFTLRRQIGATAESYNATDMTLKVKGPKADYGLEESAYEDLCYSTGNPSLSLSKGKQVSYYLQGIEPKRWGILELTANYKDSSNVSHAIVKTYEVETYGYITNPRMKGEYDSGREYTNTGWVMPVVSVTNGNSFQLYALHTMFDRVTNVNPATDTSYTHWRPVPVEFMTVVQYLLAQWAKVGPALFFGKYMMSQYGIGISGYDASQNPIYSPAVYTGSNDYDDYMETMFDNNENLSGSFVPNLYIDFLKGELYGNKLIERLHENNGEYIYNMGMSDSYNLTIPHEPAFVCLPMLAAQTNKAGTIPAFDKDGARATIINQWTSEANAAYNSAIRYGLSAAVCSDPRMANSSSYSTVNGNNVYTHMNDGGGFMVWRGYLVKMVILSPGSMLVLRSCRTKTSGGYSQIYWYIENSADFCPISQELDVTYDEGDSVAVVSFAHPSMSHGDVVCLGQSFKHEFICKVNNQDRVLTTDVGEFDLNNTNLSSSTTAKMHLDLDLSTFNIS